jgi:hypothetical protein
VRSSTPHAPRRDARSREAEKRDLEARRETLELRAIDRHMLTAIVEDFEQVMADGSNPQKEAPSLPAGEEGAGP